jgi:glycosyltransferase involved in cell wall biosynthesis
MASPKVSIIIPTRNRLPLLKRAIRSVFCQTEQNFELIVVDDCSLDGTLQYLEVLAGEDERVKLILRKEVGGGSVARNCGIFASQGQWIAFLDDDDEWISTKLELQLNKLTTTPGAVACSSSYVTRNAFGFTRMVRMPKTSNFEDLLNGSVLGGASVCICDANALRKIDGFDSSFRSGQDWDLWTRLSQIGLIVICTEATVIYGTHSGTRISTNMEAQYQGARHFYFKYRRFMSANLRINRMAYLCYIMSRQSKRGIRRRLKFLKLAFLNAPAGNNSKYVASSLPRLFIDIIFRSHLN